MGNAADLEGIARSAAQYDSDGAARVSLVSLLSQENPALGVPHFRAGWHYRTVAASQTDSVLGGAIGDLLQEILVIPATTSPGIVQIKDGSGSAITVFTGGTVSDLKPFPIPLDAISTNGAWKITTGLNVSLLIKGKFA